MAPRIPASIGIVVIMLASVVAGAGFNRKDCYAKVVRMLADGTLANDSWVFYRDKDGRPLSDRYNPVLTLYGCIEVCGGRQGWYPDIGARLTAWLVPILILVCNIDLSPLDKRRLLSVIHLLGDPIDTLWSLLDKVETWKCCYSLIEQDHRLQGMKRVAAKLLGGFEEIQGPNFDLHKSRDELVDSWPPPHNRQLWSETACEIADGRTYEFLRTCLAIFLYVFQVIAAFVPAVGGDSTSPPGGRIGTAMFLSWLVPAILLSNAVGGFTSRRTCFRIMKRFAQSSGWNLKIPNRESFLLGSAGPSTGYFDSLAWSGANYTYRPWKGKRKTSLFPRRRTALLLALSVLPMAIAMAGAVTIIWFTPPNGLNCRHVWLFGIFALWHFSAFFTWYTFDPKIATGKYHWYLTLVKDALVALSSLLIIFLSSCGLFNSCYCWSGPLRFGKEGAHIPMNSDPLFEKNGRTIYPAVAASCLGLQLCVFAVFVGTGIRGLKVMRWSEKRKSAEWNRTDNGRNIELVDQPHTAD